MSLSARYQAGEGAASVNGWEREEGNVVGESVVVAARLHQVTQCRAAGVVAKDIWVHWLARCWAAEATAGAEGRGAVTQTRDGWVGVREWAPIQVATVGAQVGGVRAQAWATTANERAEGTQARVEVRVSD